MVNKNQNIATPHPEEHKNALEWTVFFISILLVSSVFGYLIWQIITFDDSEALLRVNTYHEPSNMDPHRFRWIVKNDGGETATDVMVEFSAPEIEGEIQVVQIELPYVPRFSHREGFIHLWHPKDFENEIKGKVVSYQHP